jgi:hypothetical protein
VGKPITVDLTIDDPATEDLLYAELWPVFSSSSEKKTGLAAIQRTLLTDFRKDLQSNPVTVTIGIGAANVAGSPSKLVVTVPEGEVWELRIHALVEDALYEDDGKRRFHPALDAKLAKETLNGKTYRLQPGYRMLVEVATDGLKDADKERLWSALVPEALGSRIAVRLDTTKISTFAKWISRAEIRRQAWRWNGRTIGPFPFDVTKPDGVAQDGTPFVDPKILKWEAKAFADREDADCARSSAVIHLKNLQPLLYEEDRANDARALLYRFGVDVFSRYDGLGVPTPKLHAEHSLEPKVTTPWRRLVHRCRWTEEVPKPRVKLVVPLTEARDGDLPSATSPSTPCGLPAKPGGAAGLLVVLNEPWYEVGGLAEELLVELSRVQDPAPGFEDLPEIGPDPILTGDGWKGGMDVQLAIGDQDGPIGHTFDTDSSAPLFVSTSFVLRPPIVKDPGHKDIDLSWSFAKVRFCRQLLPAGSAIVLPEEGKSKETAPFWVQFLPDTSSFLLKTVEGDKDLSHLGIEDLTLRLPGTGGPFDVITKEAGDRVRILARLEAASGGKGGFLQALLVTRTIHDARGAEDEKYLGLYQFVGTAWAPMDGPAMMSGMDLKARIVEIQGRLGTDVKVANGQPTVWEKMFPGPLPDGADAGLPQDAVLRIVRVSRPIGTRK